jgi:cobaltochelatase CobN
LCGFASRLPQRLDRQFDLLFEATLGAPDVSAFIRRSNPEAHAAMQTRFADALRHDLWRPRRNAVAELLGQT